MATEIALDPELEYEIVNGKPEVKEPGGAKHGGTIMRLGARMGTYVEVNDLGGVYSSNTTFQIGQNQRLPDLAFVSNERMPEEGEVDGIAPMAPDLAVEVISPNDVLEKVMAKIEDYFAAGVRQVWLISLRGRTVSIYDSPTKVTILTEHEELTSEAILPGFRCRISEIFGKKRTIEKPPAEYWANTIESFRPKVRLHANSQPSLPLLHSLDIPTSAFFFPPGTTWRCFHIDG